MIADRLRILSAAELQALGEHWLAMRDGFAAAGAPSAVYHELCCLAHDEVKRREVEAREIQTMMRQGDRAAPTVEMWWGKRQQDSRE